MVVIRNSRRADISCPPLELRNRDLLMPIGRLPAVSVYGSIRRGAHIDTTGCVLQALPEATVVAGLELAPRLCDGPLHSWDGLARSRDDVALSPSGLRTSGA